MDIDEPDPKKPKAQSIVTALSRDVLKLAAITELVIAAFGVESQ